MKHKLLQRQFKKHFGAIIPPEQFEAFLNIVSSSYDHFDVDRTMLERSIDLSSEEMLDLNDKLRAENEQRKKSAEEISLLMEVIKKNEEKFRSLFDNARDPILLLDENQYFIDCNEAAVKILGAENKNQIISRLPCDFSPEFQPDGQLSSEKSIEMDHNAFRHGNTQFEWMHKSLDGTEFPVDVSLSVIPIETKNILLVHWRDITAQKIAEQKLNIQNEELQKANHALDKFVYSVSHDLRAPLSSMLGIVLLTEEDCEDPFIKENLGHVKNNILKMDNFIKDILSYARNSRQEMKKDPVLFNELLTDITGNLKYMEGTKGNVSLVLNVNQTCYFRSDNSRLSIILNNLISNAIRYHNPDEAKPSVEITVNTNEKEAHITVSDNGIGIKKELQPKVFDMFYRISENSEGSGLGLYIVKEAIDKLNGTISIESEPGVGTKFIINIPNL